MNRKFFKLSDIGVTDAGVITGYASRSGNVDLSKEVVARGAFAKTLQENPTTVVLWQHDTTEPIGVSTSLVEDGKGLRITAQLNLDTQRGREAYSLLKQGAIKGLSIGYDILRDKIEKGIRYLTELKLYEFSIVTFPCNPLANVDSVKATTLRGNKFADTFGEMNAEAQLRNGKYTMLDMLSACLSTAVFGDYGAVPPTDEEASAYMDACCSEFRDAAMAWVSTYRAFNVADMAEAAAEGKTLDRSTEDAAAYSTRAKAFAALEALLAAPLEVAEPGNAHSETERKQATEPPTPTDEPESDAPPSALDALMARVKAATPHAPSARS